MLVNRTTVLLAAAIFLIAGIYNPASAGEITIENYSDGDIPQNQTNNSQTVFTGMQTTTNNSSQIAIRCSPAIYGNRIVWEIIRNEYSNHDIFMYDISTFEETQITTSGKANDPAIYENKVVWIYYLYGNAHLYMYNLSTEREIQITTNESIKSNPEIYGDKIVWDDDRNSNESSDFYMDSNSDIYMYDLSTSKEIQITSNNSTQKIPAIYEDRIVWQDNRNGNWDIYMYNLSTSAETQITLNNLDQYEFTIDGNRIVWMDSRDLSDIYMYNITSSKEIPITTNQSSQISEINVYIRSWNLELTDPLDNATFTISGPDEIYVGNGSYWTIFNASAGTYTINHEPVSGYETPASETKNLTAENKIIFSGNYSLKKRSTDSIDLGDGYILLIKQIDTANNEALMEIQLDERTVNEMRVKKHEMVEFYKTSYSVNESGKPGLLDIIIEDISQDSDGDYIKICITPPDIEFALAPEKKLIITSIPEGANILLDREYIGKTPKEKSITDLRTYLICLELDGYEIWEEKYEIQPSNEFEIEVEALLTEKQPSPTISTTPISELRYINISSIPEGAEVFIDGRYIERTPAKIAIGDTNEHSVCLKKEGYTDYKDDFQFHSGESKIEMKLELQPLPTSPTKQEEITPSSTEEEGADFLAISVLLTLIFGYFTLRKK